MWISRTAELCLEEAEAAEARAAVLNSPARRRANGEEEGLLAMRGDGGGDSGRGRAGKEEGAAEACVGAWRLRKSDAAKREKGGVFPENAHARGVAAFCSTRCGDRWRGNSTRSFPVLQMRWSFRHLLESVLSTKFMNGNFLTI